MKCVRMMLATIGLFAISGATHAERGDDISATLYTGAVRAGLFGCNVVNVSKKTLITTISIIDPYGQPLPGGVSPLRQPRRAPKSRATSATLPSLWTRTAKFRCLARAIAMTSGSFLPPPSSEPSMKAALPTSLPL